MNRAFLQNKKNRNNNPNSFHSEAGLKFSTNGMNGGTKFNELHAKVEEINEDEKAALLQFLSCLTDSQDEERRRLTEMLLSVQKCGVNGK